MLRHKGAEFRLYGGEAVPAPLKGDRLKGRQPEARDFSRVRLHQKEKTAPDAVVVTAYRDTPFPNAYDEKAKRIVSSYRYVWEYKGEKHSMTLCDYSGNQWEHCISEFAGRPDFVPEIKITVNRNTGKYYIPKEIRERKRNDLLSLVISLAASWVIVSMIF